MILETRSHAWPITIAILTATLIACKTPDVRSVSERYVGPDSGVGGRQPETVLIPAGTFLMGTSDEQAARILAVDGDDWEEYLGWQQPQHEVYLSAYRIGRYPVTNMEYWAFVKATGHEPPRAWPGSVFEDGAANLPAGYVTYADAVAYCAWLSRATGKRYRLPTEAEWEKAARGTDGRFYPWGNEWDPDVLNSKEAGPGRLTDVGTYSPGGDSPYGAADMAGNLWEWTSDWFSPTAYADRAGERVTDPSGPATGSLRVIRGAAFNLDGVLLAHTAVRDNSAPNDVAIDDGFRVVLEVEPD
jgi:formylglycine-generating enzyme required for sulfatase activity